MTIVQITRWRCALDLFRLLPVIVLTPDLLAPGDQKSAALDLAAFSWTRIRSVDDPAFERAYQHLWAEFGAIAEMESREVLASRFQLDGPFRYEMLLVEKDGAFCAVRDHTALWVDGEIIVHLSHVLVAAEQRRTGLAGWLRAAPILTASELAISVGKPDARVTLVCEMEYNDGSEPKRAVRLAAYERAGYVKIAPAMVQYFQPDFRAPDIIDAEGTSVPIPFQLVIRRVGRESECAVSGSEVRRLIGGLYTIYGASFRPSEMEHPLLRLDRYPNAETIVALIAPTAV